MYPLSLSVAYELMGGGGGAGDCGARVLKIEVR